MEEARLKKKNVRYMIPFISNSSKCGIKHSDRKEMSGFRETGIGTKGKVEGKDYQKARGRLWGL